MARPPMTLEQIRATNPRINRARIEATTEADIHRYQIEDGEDPDAPTPQFRPAPSLRAIRAKLGLTQEALACALDIPVATIRNWEQSRTTPDPAVRALLRVLDREPEITLRALAK